MSRPLLSPLLTGHTVFRALVPTPLARRHISSSSTRQQPRLVSAALARPRLVPATYACQSSVPGAPVGVRFAIRPARFRRDEEEPEEEVNPLTLRNHEIPFRVVQLVDSVTDTVGEPRNLYEILDTVDVDTEAVIIVQLDPPVVKIVNLAEEKRKEREHEAKVKLSRRIAVDDKEVQVGWHAAPSDLQHKIALSKSLLEKGDRVHVVFAQRAGTASNNRNNSYVPAERKIEIVAMFDEALSEVGTRWKDDERTKGLWVCWWQPLPDIAAEVKNKIISAVMDKHRVRDEKKEARRLKEEERLRKAKERAAAQQSGKPLSKL